MVGISEDNIRIGSRYLDCFMGKVPVSGEPTGGSQQCRRSLADRIAHESQSLTLSICTCQVL